MNPPARRRLLPALLAAAVLTVGPTVPAPSAAAAPAPASVSAQASTLTSAVPRTLASAVHAPLPAVGSVSFGPGDCRHWAGNVPDWFPFDRGWRIECVPGHTLGTDRGVTIYGPRVIKVRNDMSFEQTKATMAHEAAHAESGEWLESDRELFRQRVGARSYHTGRWQERGAEIYAVNRARCAGWAPPRAGVKALDCPWVRHFATWAYARWTAQLPRTQRPTLEWVYDAGWGWALWRWDRGTGTWRLVPGQT